MKVSAPLDGLQRHAAPGNLGCSMASPPSPISSSRAEHSNKKTLTQKKIKTLFQGCGCFTGFAEHKKQSKTKAGSGCPRELPRLRREGPRRSGPKPSPWRRQTDPGGLSPGGKSHHFSLTLSLSLSAICFASCADGARTVLELRATL